MRKKLVALAVLTAIIGSFVFIDKADAGGRSSAAKERADLAGVLLLNQALANNSGS